jgi:hypothetical protein
MKSDKRLSREAFERSHLFLVSQGRPLDRALFEYRFEGAPAERVTVELARFQNGDHGFGHALEPDLRTPSSSALATGMALRLLQEVECPPEHPLVYGAVQFLLHTFDRSVGVWRVAPPDSNNFPHAPWWNDEYGSLADTFDDFSIIPRAQIVASLLHYSNLVQSDWLQELTDHTVSAIEAAEVDALGGGGDALRYALDLAEAQDLPLHFKDRLLLKLRAATLEVVSQNPDEWGTYCASPLKIAPVPQSVVADLLEPALQRHLDYQIEHQTPEGTWEPVWSWGASFPDAWHQARQEWRGHLTLETLTSLKAFGRLEEDGNDINIVEFY